MRIEAFFEEFELITDAPNAVAKLRELILQLAARGKLFHQHQSDRSASTLINQITAQRNTLILQGKLKDEKLLPSISSEEVLHPIPSNWIWTRLGEVVNYSGAKKVSPNEIPEDSWLLDLEDIEKDTSQIITRKTFGEKNSKSTKAKFKSGDILYGKLRPYLNKVLVADADGYCTTEIVPLQPCQGIIPEYVMYILKRPDFLSYVNSKTYGINLPRLGAEDGRKAIFPLPPTEEQKRIVEKCDRLLSLCDQIEVRQQKRQESIVRMNESAIAQLLSSQNPDEFSQHWQSICNNFDLLYSIPETIPKLRQAIWQLAVQGKLVSQNSNDEPALVLVKRMIAERDRLIAEKKINNYKPQPFIEEGEIPFDLPKGWNCVRLGEITDIASGVTKGRNLTGRKTAIYPYLRVANVQRGFLDLKVMKEIEISIEELEKYRLQVGDILLTEGGDWDKLGRSAVWQGQIQDCIHQNHVFRARPLDIGFLPEWAVMYTNSPIGRQYFETAAKRTTNLASINMTQLRYCPFPVPPAEEQKRIVAKVDRLMSLCDTLETKLKEARSHSEKLMEVAAKQILTA